MADSRFRIWESRRFNFKCFIISDDMSRSVYLSYYELVWCGWRYKWMNPEVCSDLLWGCDDLCCINHTVLGEEEDVICFMSRQHLRHACWAHMLRRGGGDTIRLSTYTRLLSSIFLFHQSLSRFVYIGLVTKTLFFVVWPDDIVSFLVHVYPCVGLISNVSCSYILV